MGAAAVPIMAAGTALQVYGAYRQNMDQAKAEIQNAEFYRQQADLARFANEREGKLFERQAAEFYGQQLGAYAKGGISFSGSALYKFAETASRIQEEAYAIKRKGDLEYELAAKRGFQSEDMARTLRSGEYNFLQGAGTVLTGAGRAVNYSQTYGG